MIDWNILGIDPTDDIKSIKRAYAAKTKEYHPEDCPEEFERLHSSYKAALEMAMNSRRRSANSEPLQYAPADNKKNKESDSDSSFDFSDIESDNKPKNYNVAENKTETSFNFSDIELGNNDNDYTSAESRSRSSFDFNDEMKNFHREHDGAVIEKTQRIIESADKITYDNSGSDKYNLWKSLFETSDFKDVKNEKIFLDTFSELLASRCIGSDSIKAIDDEFSLESLSSEIDRGVYDRLYDVMFEQRSRIKKIKNERKRKITRILLSIAAAAIFVLKILSRSGVI